MSATMRWIKYRHRWSYGGEKEWNYTDVTGIDEDALVDILEELKQDNEWSVHYRGIEYSYVDIPPLDYINTLIVEMSNRINSVMEYKVLLQKAREQYYGNESGDAGTNIV